MKKKQYYFYYLKNTEKFPRNLYHQAKHYLVDQAVSQCLSGFYILDAGCGLGNISGRYDKDYSIFGVDKEKSAIKYCRENYQGKYIKANLENLPFPQNKFNLILFLDTIEHLKNPERVLKELARVLKQKGKILICTINYANPLWFILENTWHRFFGGNCKTYSHDVHPTRYTEKLLLKQSNKYFKQIYSKNRVLAMELFYLGQKR